MSLLVTGKQHGSLARAGKVRGQTPKVEKQDKKKKKAGRAKRRIQYNRCVWCQKCRFYFRVDCLPCCAKVCTCPSVHLPCGIHEVWDRDMYSLFRTSHLETRLSLPSKRICISMPCIHPSDGRQKQYTAHVFPDTRQPSLTRSIVLLLIFSGVSSTSWEAR
jgi:ribosomal protein S30